MLSRTTLIRGGAFDDDSDDDSDMSDFDFDNGGLPSGIEWVTGGDPTNGGDDAGLTPTFDNSTDPSDFLFTFRRRDSAATA